MKNLDKSFFDNLFNILWYQSKYAYWLLWPFSLLYRVLLWLHFRRRPSSRFKTPVILVGNITVGGVGKTPLVIHLVQTLKSLGYQPGVVSRGYGAATQTFPALALDAELHGDEPVLIARLTGAPVVIDPDRPRGVKFLLESVPACDVVISDDGLQHKALARDFEILVVDAERGFGNGCLLPAGPLREPLGRIHSVSHIVVNGEKPPAELKTVKAPISFMRMKVCGFFRVADDQPVPEAVWQNQQQVMALCGIGHPERFFKTLDKLNLTYEPHIFPDHHTYTKADMIFSLTGDRPLVMTEKDAVKLQHLATERWWYLKLDIEVSETLIEAVLKKLK